MWLTAHTNEATIRVKTNGLDRRHKNADLQGKTLSVEWHKDEAKRWP